MMPRDMSITFEIEPIVKVVCMATNCANHVWRYQNEMYCNLKHITLDEDGQCNNFEVKDEEKAKS